MPAYDYSSSNFLQLSQRPGYGSRNSMSIVADRSPSRFNLVADARNYVALERRSLISTRFRTPTTILRRMPPWALVFGQASVIRALLQIVFNN